MFTFATRAYLDAPSGHRLVCAQGRVQVTDTAQDPAADYTIQRLTTLSPIRPKRLGSLRRWLAFVAWTPGVGRPLLELSTIHYARWIILSALPDPDGADKEWLLNWKYLLFHATYDGPRDEYLDMFGDVLPLRLARLFGTCFGFESRVEDAPGAGDRVFPTYAFRDFVIANKLCELGFYNHRSDAVRVIRQALAIEHAEHAADSTRGGAGRTQSEVASLALGAPLVQPGWGEALLGPTLRRARPSVSVNPLTVIAPLRDDHDDEPLSEPIRSLPRALFASVAVIPRTMKAQLGQVHPDVLPVDYLLFTGDFYGEPSDYIEALRTHPQTKAILRQCVGFPEHGWDFKKWITRHSVNTQYYLAGYPPRSPAELKRLLDTRAAIAQDITAHAVQP